ncbi:MAG TPA: hypothetical protein VLM75_03670 [Spirochaetota bacterium]|nr:hypothetical protein [Spirochaetota bacterium]
MNEILPDIFVVRERGAFGAFRPGMVRGRVALTLRFLELRGMVNISDGMGGARFFPAVVGRSADGCGTSDTCDEKMGQAGETVMRSAIGGRPIRPRGIKK